MAKGYMIFIEDGDLPKIVHRTHRSALRELHRLANSNPGKKAYLMQLHDRIVSDGVQGVTIGTHLPIDERINIHESELVRGDTLYKANK